MHKGVFLLLLSKNTFLIEAYGTVDEDKVLVRQSLPLEKRQDIFSAIVHYTARTKNYVILDRASQEGPFTQDPYVQSRKPKSVLCLPILYQSQLRGILYLENKVIYSA